MTVPFNSLHPIWDRQRDFIDVRSSVDEIHERTISIRRGRAQTCWKSLGNDCDQWRWIMKGRVEIVRKAFEAFLQSKKRRTQFAYKGVRFDWLKTRPGNRAVLLFDSARITPYTISLPPRIMTPLETHIPRSHTRRRVITFFPASNFDRKGGDVCENDMVMATDARSISDPEEFRRLSLRMKRYVMLKPNEDALLCEDVK